MELNGIAPTRENVANRTYPYASEFYAITAGTDNPNVNTLIEWILSEQGQYLIEKTGYTPMQ
jgi:phosphate transport system substrate-binding protein